MFNPRVTNFPLPKILSSTKKSSDLEFIKELISTNYFYESVVVTLPDELNVPTAIEETLTYDRDYYKLSKCPLPLFLVEEFVNSFVKNGDLYCLSYNSDTYVDNCAAITPDSTLILHIPEYIFQTLGVDGTTLPYKYREVRINLNNSKEIARFKDKLAILEPIDLMIFWKPHNEEICPSSIAKYFNDNCIEVTLETHTATLLNPAIERIPITDVEPEELAEWIGMLALEADLKPENEFISSYSEPESDKPIESSRIAVFTIKGLTTPDILHTLCDNIALHVKNRNVENYWSSISFQSYNNCPWRWSAKSPNNFQKIDASTTIFFTKDLNIAYSIGQIKVP